MPLKIFAGLRPIHRSQLARDILAGVNLASVNIPQVLGYTRIAGTPVVTGLYTLLLPVIAFAVFGSSRHLVVAADSATAAIFSSSLSRMAVPASEQYLALVGMVALLTAGALLAARIFKLGFLADFLSRTVLVGFLAGVGLQVGIAMLRDMTGVAVDSRYTLVQAWGVLQGLSQPNVPTIALSAAVAASILLGNRFAPATAHFAAGRDRRDSGKRRISLCQPRHRRHRHRARRLASLWAAEGHLERNPGVAAGGRIMLRDHHRAKRSDLVRFRGTLPGERR